MAGRPPTATILKIIRGETRPSRLRDDRPKIARAPEMPPGTVLSEAETKMWDWMLEHVALENVHATCDGASFVKVARLWARCNEVDAKIAQFGMVMRDPHSGKPMLQPYTRLSRDLWRQLGIALGEIGATASGRVRLAGPRGPMGSRDPSSWDDIE